LINNNLTLEGAMNLILVPFWLSNNVQYAYKILAKSIDFPKMVNHEL